jgi:hypothetical protein
MNFVQGDLEWQQSTTFGHGSNRPLADIQLLGFNHHMPIPLADLSRSLEQLTGWSEGNPDEAPTEMIAAIQRSWTKPLRELDDYEIVELVIQQYGYPYLLDLVWPKLEHDPLFEGGYYPGDVLSNLLRAEPQIWVDRPTYKAALEGLYRRALERTPDEIESFRESLGLPGSDSPPN